MLAAIYEGHINIIKYLHENARPGYSSKLKFAIPYKYKCTNIVKYLHENGYPLDQSACRFANYNGHQNGLKNGCPCDSMTHESAIHHGYVKCQRENVVHGIKITVN